MNNFFSPLPENINPQARNAYRATLVLLVILVLFDIYATYNLVTIGTMDRIIAALTSYGMTAVVFAGLWASRRGRGDIAGWLLIGGSLASLFLSMFTRSGVGILYALVGLVITSAIGGLTLPRRQFWLAVLVSVLAGIVYILIDVFFPAKQASVSSTFTYVMFAGLILGEIILVVRHFQGSIAKFLRASISNRLTTIVVGSAIVPVVLVSLVLGWATYQQVQSALTDEAFSKLAAVQKIKANQLESYLSERRSDMAALSDTVGSLLVEAEAKMGAINSLKRDQVAQFFNTWDADVRDVASDPGVVAGVIDMTAGFQDIGSSKVRFLYLGQAELEIAKDGSAYSAAHLEQHTFFSGYTAIHGYEDALLIDLAGNVIYSRQKNGVFGSNLVTGAYKDTNLAKLYQNLSKGTAGKAYIADAALFDDKYVMFIGAPIYQREKLVGILAYQLPLDAIKNITAERIGQGATGETYMIAMEEDGRITYRSDRTIEGGGKFVIGYDISDIAPQFVRDALSGKTGNKLTTGGLGITIINAYRPLEIEGLTWAVFSKINAAEALSPTHQSGEKDFLTTYKETYGYYDIFLIDPNGLIFYSVLQENEYKTNILTGEYKDTNLGSMVADIIKSKSIKFTDFAFYAPTGGRPAAFFGIPLLDETNEVEMIVAAQASQEQLGAIMAETTGLGETGETFVVGQDKLRRTETRFLADLGVESTILNPQFEVDTVATRSALIGESGQAIFNDFRGIPVMAVWSPVSLVGTNESTPDAQSWGVIAKIDQSEALALVNQLAGTLGIIIGLAVLGIGAVAVFLGTRFAFGFVAPILTLTNTATQVAGGNMNLSVDVKSEDEIGTLSNAFNSMTSQLRELIGSLEGRVAARTKDLATVAEVGTATATILETGRLLQEVVNLSKERFNLYHSHIYLLDETGENLVLTAGAGEPGRIMVAEKRTIPLSREQSLVARAARERIGVTVNDVTLAPDFLPNPLLPETRSELAVPMIVGGKVIGVFDIQSEQVGRFSDSDVNIQTTLASQIATSIQNVRSFEQSKSQADFESLVNAIGQKIQRATTVEDTLQVAIREIGLALGASRVSVNVQAHRQEDAEKTQTEAVSSVVQND
jgi:methyl-accepting chemotaxis protein